MLIQTTCSAQDLKKELNDYKQSHKQELSDIEDLLWSSDFETSTLGAEMLNVVFDQQLDANSWIYCLTFLRIL